MLNKNTLTLSVMSLCLLAGCTTSTAKLEADTAAQAVQLEQSQKALTELNKQVKGQSDILTAALAKAVPDHSAAQRLAKESAQLHLQQQAHAKALKDFSVGANS